MEEKAKYRWVWVGVILGTIFALIRFEEGSGYETNSPPFLVTIIPDWLAFLLPIFGLVVGLIFDFKITNRNAKKESIKKLTTAKKIEFNLKYAKIGAILCFIWGLILTPLYWTGSGILSEVDYFMYTFPAIFISLPIVRILPFWIGTSHDVMEVVIHILSLTLVGFLVGFIIPNFKRVIAYSVKFCKKLGRNVSEAV